MVSRIRTILLVTLVSLLISPMLVIISTPVAYAANCTSPCKKDAQWSGGAVGAQERMVNLDSTPGCYTGCVWIQRGLYVKNSSTGTYMFLGTETTPNGSNYIYTVWHPNSFTHIILFPETAVTPSGYAFYTVLYGNTPYGPSMVIYLDVYYDSYNEQWFYDGGTPMTENVVDTIQTGARIYASSATAAYVPYRTTDHSWACGSCQYTWYNQVTDGTFVVIGSSYALYQTWDVHPAPGNNGGTYYNSCYGPCP